MCKQAELCFSDADPIYLMAIDLMKYVKGRLR